MKAIKKYQHYILALFLGIFIFFGLPLAWKEVKWMVYSKEAHAIGFTYPSNCGIAKGISTPCIPAPPSNACPSNPLCATMPPGVCGTYAAITGTMSGGNCPTGFLISNLALGEIGFVPGADIIAAGNAINFIEVAASWGGCFGCIVEGNTNSIPFKMVENIDNFFKQLKYYIAIKAPNQ